MKCFPVGIGVNKETVEMFEENFGGGGIQKNNLPKIKNGGKRTFPAFSQKEWRKK
ncbi:MAG: hypothetical protein Q8P63_00710 [Candidatus Nealsonbacteria bacterium]|nr:hypothetical protein [Candidatus Nealsonbacteria bacterium]